MVSKRMFGQQRGVRGWVVGAVSYLVVQVQCLANSSLYSRETLIATRVRDQVAQCSALQLEESRKRCSWSRPTLTVSRRRSRVQCLSMPRFCPLSHVTSHCFEIIAKTLKPLLLMNVSLAFHTHDTTTSTPENTVAMARRPARCYRYCKNKVRSIQ